MKNFLFLQLRGTPASPDDGAENVPFAAGCLVSYLKSKGLGKKFRFIIPKNEVCNDWGDERLINYIASLRPAWVSFTLYLWNVERSLYIASKIKERLPNCRIVVGGPEVARDNTWLIENNSVDHFVAGEGEKILHRLLANKGKTHGSTGSPRTNNFPKFLEARHELKTFNSPYFSGVLSMRKNEPVYIETQRGCPFKCTFCFYPKTGKKIRQLPLKKLEILIKKALKNGVTDLIFTDPTFNNYQPFDDLLDLLIKMNPNKKLRFHAEIKPHMLSTAQIKKMNRAGFATLEAGLQTIKKTTQKRIKCVIPVEKFFENINRLDKKISVRLDLISGLPGESLEDIKASIRYARKHCPTADLYLYHLSVLPGTEMRRLPLTPRQTTGGQATLSPLRQAQDAARGRGSFSYQPRPPYYVLNNGRIGKEGLRRANEFFERVTGEELDPAPDVEKIYREKIAPSTRSGRTKRDVPLFNVIEFRAKGTNKDEMLKNLKEMTGKNPYSTFVIFIDGEKKRLQEEIMRCADLEYAQNINRGRICSRLKIANLYLVFHIPGV